MYDLLIKNGNVFLHDKFIKCNLAIKNSRILKNNKNKRKNIKNKQKK